VEDAAAAANRAHVSAGSRQARLDDATAAFRRATGRVPAWGWFVPGRLEVFGKHTDYAGGRSLVAATSRGIAVVAAPRDDGVVRVVDGVRPGSDRGSTRVRPPGASRAGAFTALARDAGGRTLVEPRSDPGLTPYVAAVVERLARDFPDAPLGVDIAFASDLPRAAGLSSSSALMIAVASAIVERGALAKQPAWAAAIRSPLDLAGYLAAIESGAGFGPFPGAAGVGTHGGSEDHTAILTGRDGHLSAYRYAPIAPLGEVPVPDAWTFVIATSGVAAEKTGAARERYNRASGLTQQLLALWNDHHDAAPTLAAALASGPDAVDDLLAIASRARAGRTLVDRLRHFVREDARIPPAVDAFRAADAAGLGRLSADSQADADHLLGNQIEETRVLARLARECGADAASSFGAGFGGSVWALVDTAAAAAFERDWTAAYTRAVPGRLIESFATRGGAGLAPWPVC
jgi:galactokinase